MDNEILAVLQEIRGALYVIAAVLVTWFIFWVITPASLMRTIFKSSLEGNWKNEAIELYESGNFDKLITHCQTREKTHKYDPAALYWQARVFIKKGETDKANDLFKRIREVSPEWYDEYVKPHYYENENRNF